MKNLLVLITFIVISSFTTKEEKNALPDGHYFVSVDEEYKKGGILDFEFTIENDKFIIKLADKINTFDVIWTDKNSFIVKGYTEPVSPDAFELKILKKYKPTFNIIKQVENDYYFTLGPESDESPIFSGKFTKSNTKK